MYSTSNGNGGNDAITFAAVQARYIMLDSTDWRSGSLRNWLNEFEIFAGSGGPGPTATPIPPPTNTPIPPPTATPTSIPGGDPEIHVGDLAGSSSPNDRNRWSATVIVLVHATDETAVNNATVYGSWSNGASGSGSCVTNSSGSCTVSKSNIKNNVSGVNFTIDAVSHASMSYQPSDNHDNGGDGFSIAVSKP